MKKKLLLILGIIAAVAVIAIVVIISLPAKDYQVKFIADGEVVEIETYNEDDLTITEPAVPNKPGYTAVWEEYTLSNSDVEVNAIYTPIEYTATFKVNGEVINTLTFTVETQSLIEPLIPEKNGYIASWESYTLSANNIEINAVYTLAEYEVSFVADGIEISTDTYTINDKNITEPIVPQKVGYIGNWESYTLTAGNVVVNAIYTPIEYTVTFIADGIEVEILTYDAENKNITEPTVPNKPGYNGDWEVYELTIGNVVVNAVYTPIEYRVTFIADGVEVEVLKYTVENKVLTEPTVPNKPGYNGDWEVYELTIGNVVVNAVYTPIEYTVTFIADGVEVEALKYTVENKVLTEPTVPNKPGYTGDWESYELTLGNIVVNAVYTHIPVNVTFVLNYPDAQNEVKTTVDGLIDFVPVRTGYQFNGWWISSGSTEDGYILIEKFDMSQIIIDSDLTLYAEWVEIPTDDKQLPVPSVSINENVFSWNSVERAESYSIIVLDSNYETIVDTITNELSWVLPSSYVAGRYTIKVRANGNGLDTINSEYVTKYYRHNILDGVYGLNFDITNSILTWDSVEYAEGYNIYVDYNFVEYVTSTNYDFSSYQAGSYYVRIESVKSDWVSGYGTYSFDKKRLATPNVAIEFNHTNGIYEISWNAISYANTYYIYINDQEFTTTSTSFELAYDADVIQNKDIFTVYVNAFDTNHDFFVSYDSATQTIDKYYKFDIETEEGLDELLINEVNVSSIYAVCNSNIVIKISTLDGYNFIGWYQNDEQISSLDELSITLTSDTKVTAKFNYFELTTSKNYSDAGLITNYAYEKVSVGTEVSLTATELNGYNFIGWYLNDELISTEKTFVYVMTANNVTLVAKYNYFTVTTESTHINSGTITEYNNTKIQVGQTVKLTATLNNGYNFLGWYNGETLLTEELEYEFIMEKENITLTATYEEIPVTLIYILNGQEYAREEYTNETPITTFKKYEYTAGVLESFYGWYMDRYFDTTDSKVVSSTDLAVDSENCAYVYGALVDTRQFTTYKYDEEKHGYTIVGEYTFTGHQTITVPGKFNGLTIKTLDYTTTSSNTVTEVIVSEGIEIIKNKFIYGLSNLSNVSLPSTLKEISNQAFNAINQLTELYLPASIEKIGDEKYNHVFSSQLEKVYYAGTIEDWCNIEIVGRGYVMDYAEEFYLGNGTGSYALLKDLIIPDTVTTIKNNQFYGFDCLESVTIDQNVTSIEEYAFAYCGNLKTVTFESESKLSSIGYNAFYYSGIISIQVPASVETIGQEAFAYCSSLTTFDFEANSKLKEIPRYLIYNCPSITTITIPNIDSFKGELTPGTSALTIYYQGTIEDWIKLNETKIINCVCERFYIYENSEYKEVIELVIPETITTIHDSLFKNYTGISKLTLHDKLTSIGSNSFENTSLTEIIIPASVEIIGLNAFNSCDNLTNVTIKKVNTITSDTTYFKHIFGDTVNVITSVRMLDGTVPAKALDGILNLAHLTVPYINNTSLTDGTLLGYMFGTEKYSDTYLFQTSQSTNKSNGGDYIYYVPSLLKSVEILSGKISRYALMNFQYIEELTIGEGVTYLDECITIRTYRLNKINYNAINATTKPVYNTDKLDVFYGLGTGQASTHSVTINIGDKVEVIPSFLFCEDSKITSVNISNNSVLTTIDKYAFENTAISEITLPKSLTSILKSAFSGCGSLNTVYYLGNVEDWCDITFENESSNPTSNNVTLWFTNANGAFERYDALTISDVESIGAYQFVNFNDLLSLTISNVNIIDKYAFSGCANLGTLTLENIETIGSGAFSSCTTLTEINIPEGAKTIASAFVNCSNVEKLYLPSTIETIAGAFAYMYALQDVYYNGTLEDWFNIIFSSEDSNPMTYATNLYVLDTDNNYYLVENINVPSTITAIGAYQLAGFKNIKTLNIPNTVTSIGAGAFKNIKAENIYYNASITEGLSLIFEGTSGNLVVGKDVTIINNSLFKDSKLVNVSFEENSSCSTISAYAFMNCAKLESLLIPNSVTTIEKTALYGCSNIVTLEIPFTGTSSTATTASKDTLFGNIFGTTSFENAVQTQQYYSTSAYAYFYIPSTLKNIKVNNTVLGYAFYNVQNIESVTMGSNVESIGVYAFYNSSIQSLDFEENSNCTLIDQYAFNTCKSLSSVNLPEGLEIIRYYAFQNCTRISEIKVPITMTEIQVNAFLGCANLIAVQNLSTLAITKGATTHGYVAYYAKVVYGEGENPIKNVDGFMFYDDGTSVSLLGYSGTNTSITLPSSYNGSEYTIDSDAFVGNTIITSVTLPDTFTVVTEGMFENCTSLTMVTLPNTITTISTNAFSGCTALTTINIPSTLESLSKDAFTGCTNLIKTINNVDYVNNWAVGINSTATSITFQTSTVGLADNLFDLNTTITTVKLQGSIKYIPTECFAWSSVTTVTLNAGLQSIGDKAFERCTKLTSITIPNSVVEIGNSAFSNCTSLAALTFQTTSKVVSIGNYAFNKCTSLKTVTLPISVTSLGNAAFKECTALTTFGTGNGLVTLSDETLSGCTALTKVTLGTKVQTIGAQVFYGCSALQTITIPSSVESIGEQAFKSCTKLTNVTFSDTTNTWTANNKTIKVTNATTNSTYLKGTHADYSWTKNVA